MIVRLVTEETEKNVRPNESWSEIEGVGDGMDVEFEYEGVESYAAAADNVEEDWQWRMINALTWSLAILAASALFAFGGLASASEGGPDMRSECQALLESGELVLTAAWFADQGANYAAFEEWGELNGGHPRSALYSQEQEMNDDFSHDVR